MSSKDAIEGPRAFLEELLYQRRHGHFQKLLTDVGLVELRASHDATPRSAASS